MQDNFSQKYTIWQYIESNWVCSTDNILIQLEFFDQKSDQIRVNKAHMKRAPLLPAPAVLL